MNDSIIKNKYRTTMGEIVNKRYTPEYVRLNKIPVTMIDNNDFVDINTISNEINEVSEGYINGDILDDISEEYDQTSVHTESKKETQNLPKINECILMVFGEVVSTGSTKDVEKEVQKILYKEHSSFLDKKISIDDIVVLKRLDIKFGVFLGE